MTNKDRRLTCHPVPRFAKIVIAKAFENGGDKASVLKTIIENYVSGMPQSEQERLIRRYEIMTLEERQSPAGRGRKRIQTSV